MEHYFVTVTGLDHYYGKKPFKSGAILKLVKDKYNTHDSEAIRVVMPFIDTVGFVANSPNTVFEGTVSAGRLYDKFDEVIMARVMFVTHSSVIAYVVFPRIDIDFSFADEQNIEDDVISF